MDMRFIVTWLGLALSFCSLSSNAREALCAEVKIEILQELTMERQGFEALMRITNSLDTFSLENVSVKVLFKDVDGNPVVATSNTSASNAAFFIRVDDTRDVTGLQNGTDGFIQGGSIAPKKIGELRWLIIPTANAAGQTKDGKLFFVGAELKYSYGGKEEVVDVAADSIVVKPQPALTLDYFLTEQVVGDNGFTTEIEPSEPYTLGVRINNNGFGSANKVKIESAQPRIVDNKLGLAVNFKILGSYLKDQPSSPSLLINFGDIEPKGITTGRWIMESNLAGEFIAFNASFTHADELGGELTSLLQGVNANFLVRDVVMDLPGRDNLRDFLAYSATRELYVFESEPTGANEITCTNCKKVNEINNAAVQPGDTSHSQFTFQPVGGLTFASAKDPFDGNKLLAKVVRENGTVVHPQNAWLSKKRASDKINFDYFINIFDNNSSGKYTIYWGGNLVDVPQPPVLQYVQDQVTYEGGNLGFFIRATDPNNTLPTISALQMPAGASFTPSTVNEGVFSWSPSVGQAGSYTVTFAATDGELSTQRAVVITVFPANDTDGDGLDDDWEREHFGNLDKNGTEDSDGDGRTDLQEFEDGTNPNIIESAPAAPQILSPIFDADTLQEESLPLQPELVVTNGDHPTDIHSVAVLFEVYQDEAMTELMGTITLDEGSGAASEGEGTTHWKISPVDLEEGMEFADNKIYYWRAKSVQKEGGSATSLWVTSQFFINTQNDLPSIPQISFPALDASITELSPTLQINNSSDVDRDELRYGFELYAESDLANPIATVSNVLAGNNGQTSWFVAKVLEENARYVWRANVTDTQGAVVNSPWSGFMVNLQNNPPTLPQVAAPQTASTVVELLEGNSIQLRVANSKDPERQAVKYYFELDVVNTFDSEHKQSSPAITEGDTETSWTVSGLMDNTLYFWRVKASDDEAESAWVFGNFTVDLLSQSPSTPVPQNPTGGVVISTDYVVLEANTSIDPEGSIVSYHFELYSDEQLTQLINSSLSLSPVLNLGSILVDKQNYFWRVRAEDEDGQFSDWSEVEVFTVNLPGINQVPQIELVAPTSALSLRTGLITVQWQDSDPDSNANITLFAIPQLSNGAGEPITVATNISEDADGEGDIYQLEASDLPPGNYRFGVKIEDEQNTSTVIGCCLLEVLPPLAGLLPHSHWPFNEGSGDITNSLVGAYTSPLSVSGVDSGTTAEVKPTWVAGRNGASALLFDGIGGYLSVDRSITAPLLSSSTLSFWINTSATGGWGNPASAPAIIGSQVDKGALHNNIKWGSLGVQGQVGIAVGNVRVMGLSKINDGKWHHVVITRNVDSGSANGSVKIYVDGYLDAHAEPKDPLFTGLLNTFVGFGISNKVYINTSNTNYIGSGTRFFKGMLDDIRIYAHALSSVEIQELYSSESGVTPHASAHEQFINNGVYQAENVSIFNGVVASNRAGYQGIGFVDYSGLGGYIEWIVERDQDGAAILEFAYSNGSGTNFPLEITINGVVVNAALPFPATTNWSTWRRVEMPVNLIRGKNIIRAYVASGNGTTDGPHIDFMKIK